VTNTLRISIYYRSSFETSTDHGHGSAKFIDKYRPTAYRENNDKLYI